MNLIKETEKYLCNVINELGFNLQKVSLIPSSRPELGQFQINEAFSLAKDNHLNPKDIAEKIVSKLDNRFTKYLEKPKCPITAAFILFNLLYIFDFFYKSIK